jgi:hypothetical protein
MRRTTSVTLPVEAASGRTEIAAFVFATVNSNLLAAATMVNPWFFARTVKCLRQLHTIHVECRHLLL